MMGTNIRQRRGRIRIGDPVNAGMLAEFDVLLIRAAHLDSPVVLLLEEHNAEQYSITNGAEHYWPRAIPQLLGANHPTEYLVMLDGYHKNNRVASWPDYVRFPSVRAGSFNWGRARFEETDENMKLLLASALANGGMELSGAVLKDCEALGIA